MFESASAFLPRVENVLCDSDYKGQPFANKIREILNCSVEVVKRSDVGMFKVIPKRWVGESMLCKAQEISAVVQECGAKNFNE
ncbi:MAG: hypothetical protein LBF82_00205 [Lactobacillales bacterium]|jgi:hypothetical protein|nr:hypothetical protein [Lactobacillales bacterium]